MTDGQLSITSARHPKRFYRAVLFGTHTSVPSNWVIGGGNPYMVWSTPPSTKTLKMPKVNIPRPRGGSLCRLNPDAKLQDAISPPYSF